MKKTDHIFLGGDDFTEVCAQIVEQQFLEENSLDGVSETIREKMNKQFHMSGEKVKLDLSMKDVDSRRN